MTAGDDVLPRRNLKSARAASGSGSGNENDAVLARKRKAKGGGTGIGFVGPEGSSEDCPLRRVLRWEVLSYDAEGANVVVTSPADKTRLCWVPLACAVASASASRLRRAEKETEVSKRPQFDNVTNTRVIAVEVRVKNSGEMLDRWCWVFRSSANEQTGRQMDRSAQSGKTALPGTDNSQGKKLNAWTIGLSCGKARA
eukprot:1657573-Pleurochrysis_carterae.AAC.1